MLSFGRLFPNYRAWLARRRREKNLRGSLRTSSRLPGSRTLTMSPLEEQEATTLLTTSCLSAGHITLNGKNRGRDQAM